MVFALAVLAGGVILHRSITNPSLMSFHHDRLQFERPKGWLPGTVLTSKPAALTGMISKGGFGAPQPVAEATSWTRSYTSARNPSHRINVRIAPRPTYPNLQGVLDVKRLGRYGEYYWAQHSEDVTIADGQTWLRTEFRYAYKSSKTSAPKIAVAVEYAILNGATLFIVTLHGSPENVSELDQLVSPTLRIKPENGVTD